MIAIKHECEYSKKKNKKKTSFTSWSAQEDEWQWFYSDVLACSERTLILFSVMGIVSPPASSDFAYNLGLIVGVGGGALLHPHTKQLATIMHHLYLDMPLLLCVLVNDPCTYGPHARMDPMHVWTPRTYGPLASMDPLQVWTPCPMHIWTPCTYGPHPLPVWILGYTQLSCEESNLLEELQCHYSNNHCYNY